MKKIKVVKRSLNLSNMNVEICALRTFDDRKSAQKYVKDLLQRAYEKRMSGYFTKVGAVSKNGFIAHSSTHQFEFEVR
jgi:ribosomal protein L35AE/L33A